MKPYPYLTEEGRIRRLRELAADVLDHYDLEVERIKLVADETNTTFRVETTDGRLFALRVGAEADDTDVDTATELAWLKALARHPHISAAVPRANKKGRLITVAQHPAVPGERKCVLFNWIPGVPVGDEAQRVDYGMLGELSAMLHDHGASWRMPRRLKPLVWDRVFYYPTEPVVLYDGRFRSLMTPERRAIVQAVEELASAELVRLHRDVPISIVHGDLHPWNVHMYEAELHVFDFEDVMLAAPVQDIAITLFYNRNHPDYEGLRAAFQDGYTSVRDWPVEYEGQLELLMAARTVMFVNYVLRRGRNPAEYVPMAVERISRVLS